MIDWQVVSKHCTGAYGKERGQTITDKLYRLDNRAYHATRGFTSLWWHKKDNYPETKKSKEHKIYTLNEMKFGETALDEIIATAEYLKAELHKEIENLQEEE